MAGAREPLCWSVPKNGNFKNLVLDLGGVIMTWDGGESGNLGGPVDPKLLKHMLQDSIWNEYENGKLTSAQTYDKLSIKFGVLAKGIESTLNFARNTLTPIADIVKVIEESRGLLRLFCMTNIPAPEFEYLEDNFPELWQNFEKIYTSADVGMRKPDLVFFRHVLRDAGIDPRETIFVDDTMQNCVAARSLGMKAILCKNIDSAVQELFCNLRGEEERLSVARRYLDGVLTDQRRDLETVTLKGDRLSDDFSEFLIADILQDERFLPMASAPDNGELFYTRDVDTKKWLLTLWLLI